MDTTLETKKWAKHIDHDIVELINQSIMLVNKVAHWDTKFHDYSFVVFPAAKAFEGFLKNFFLDQGFISKTEYEYKYFRIGKALNPELEKKLRPTESVYDRIVDYCNGRDLADTLWATWKNSRNLLFHWYPYERNAITYEEAKQNIQMIVDAIDMTFKECKIDYAH